LNCPSFVALHLQESGGKNYKLNAKEMPVLVDELQKRLASEGYVISRCFLDIQCELIEEFTVCFLTSIEGVGARKKSGWGSA